MDSSRSPPAPRWRALPARLVHVRRSERTLLALAFAYFFCVLASYYVLRPIRDAMGVESGIEKLPWLFLGTLLVTVSISPLFSRLVARKPRREVVAWSHRVLIACLLVFHALSIVLDDAARIWLGRAFFIWLSVFNVFAISLVWTVMSDVFRTTQARRLYGVIAAGGTLGGVCGGVATGWLIGRIGAAGLLLLAAALLEIAVHCMAALGRRAGSGSGARARAARAAIGGSMFAGFTGVVRSPYLLGIGGFMLLYTIGSTFLYFLQAQIVGATIHDAAARTAYFAGVDVWVNALTLLIQLGITGRVLSHLGVTVTLALLPALSLIGFMLLGFAPILAAVIVFQVIRRTGNFALTAPARETLYVPLAREEKYKAKNFIDTFMFRSGDQVGAWLHAALLALGFGIGGIAMVGVPVSAAWLALAVWLGRRNARLRAAEPATATATSVRC